MSGLLMPPRSAQRALRRLGSHHVRAGRGHRGQKREGECRSINQWRRVSQDIEQTKRV